MQNANLVSLGARGAAALLGLALAGCGSGKSSQAAAPTKSVWDPFTIDVGGRPARLQVAVTRPEQERGLMQRSDLGKDDGMIFVNTAPRPLSIWMHNTPEALDLGYIGPDGVIAEVYPLYPYDERPVPSHGDRMQFALEMPQGWFAANSIRPGARVDIKAVAAALRARGFDPAKFGLE
jgi:uncharacterized protein